MAGFAAVLHTASILKSSPEGDFFLKITDKLIFNFNYLVPDKYVIFVTRGLESLIQYQEDFP